MEEIEIWKDIIGYENYYQISSFGRIKSKERSFKRQKYIHVYKPKILSLIKQKSHPYLTIRLNNGAMTKGYLVHRLVALTFIPNPKFKKEVNHIDANPTNNNVNNLEWCTPSENVKHSFKIGKASHKGENNSNSKLTKNDIIEIRIMIKAGYTNKFIANIFHVTASSIYCIKTKKQWAHI